MLGAPGTLRRLDAGWHPDPYGGASWRHWDGARWTAHTAPRYAEGFTPLHTLGGQSILLHQKVGGGRREMRAGDALAGVLDIPSMGDTHAHTAEGSWYLDIPLVMQTNVVVKVLPPKLEIARFDWAGLGMTSGGTLRFPDGRLFTLTPASGGKTTMGIGGGDLMAPVPAEGHWAFVGPEGAPLVSVDLRWPETKVVKWGTGRTTADIWTTIHPAAARAVELPVLVLLGTFLVWWKMSLQEGRARD